MADFDPKALIKQYAAAVNAHDMDRLVALFDTQALIKDIAQMPLDKLRFESVVDLRGGRWPRAEAAVLDYYGTWFEAVPDLTLVLYGLVASGAQAALELTLQGTHRGEFLGLPASSNRIGCRAVSMFQFMHGRIHEQRLYYDLATLQRQMSRAATEVRR